jgi:hypothetical protein
MPRDRRRDDDEDEDDRPARKRRRVEEDDEDEAPRPKPKPKPRVVDEDEDEPPRRVKPRVVDEDDEDEEEERPRRRKKKRKPAGMNKGLLFGLIGGGLALVLVVVLLIVFLGGSSPKSVMEKLIRASKAKDYGALYDNMSSKMQQRLADGPKFPGMGTVTATDPRERFIETMKALEKLGAAATPFEREGEATVLSETITGDTAKVKIRNGNGREADVPFIKENGRWKLDGR